MLQIHHSNRLEVLFLRLRDLLDGAGGDLFAPRSIVVQNPGMGRWLAHRFAEQDGVVANLEHLLPASFFWQALRAWRPVLPEMSGFDRPVLGWRVYRLLPERLGEPAFRPLAACLDTAHRGLNAWQLAQRIAEVFDRYLLYRPDLVLGWEAGQGDEWQAQLWRALAAAVGQPHRARLLADLQEDLEQGTAPAAPALLPEPVVLFGLSALPPVYCALLKALAARRDVHLLVPNPCAEYWADVIDDRGRARRRARAQAARQPDPGPLLDIGNPLLASLGHTGQAFLDQVLELEDESEHLFLAPAGDRLLDRLQRDMLNLEDPRRGAPDERAWLAAEDESLLIHRCHSPLREVQVLHDRLLALFQRPDGDAPPLEPRDCLIMAPDIDVYAPFIEAVFGAAPPQRRIPWSIADRRLGAEQPLLAAFRELLALPRSRLTAAEVLGWLEVPAIARRFSLAAGDVDRLRAWVAETGIRWGLDAGMRAGLGLPGDDANSWAFGLRRLFLGYALPPDAGLYGQASPYPDVEGSDAALLGQLQAFIDRLGQWRDGLQRSRPAADWRRFLDGMLDGLFAPDEDEEAVVQRLREALDDLPVHTAEAGLDEPLEPDIVRALLEQVIDEPGGSARFLTGRVTFCNLVPMRSIPARVIGLLGMNSAEFPRSQHPPSFDLVARHPRRGDRSRRNDDRYLFLEALLSARGHLHISFVGRDLRDNSLKVPSVVVEELIDVIDRSYRVPGAPDGLPSAHLVVDHPLQPFSPRCFDGADPRLWSHAAEWLPEAADAGEGAFADAELDGTPPAGIELDDLIRFLRAPARWFLEQRLRLRLPREEAPPEDAEPFTIDGLERWALGQQLLVLAQQQALDQALPRLRADGVLPHGAAGAVLLEDEVERVQRFQDELDRLLAGQGTLARIELDLPVTPGGAYPELRLRGWLDGVGADGLTGHRLGRLRARDLLELWLRHLALNAVLAERPDPAVTPRSRFLSEDKGALTLTELEPVDDAATILGDLCALFLDGQRAPLPLFPESSLAWVRDADHGKVLDAWNDRWNGYPGEGSDAAVQTAFRGHPDPLDDSFRRLAGRVFGPLLAAMPGDEP